MVSPEPPQVLYCISCFDALLQLSVNGFIAKSKTDRKLYKRQGQPPFLKATAQQALEPACMIISVALLQSVSHR